MDARGRGRPKKVTFSHKFKLSEEEDRETRVKALINNLDRLRYEYGESCVDTLLQKLLITLTYEDMVVEISGRGGMIIESNNRLNLVGRGNETNGAGDDDSGISIADAFSIGDIGG